MAEDKRKEIPIEDGNAEKENPKEDQDLKESEVEAAESGAADKTEPAEEAQETDQEKAAREAAEKAAEAVKAAEQAAKQESERYLRLLADFQNFRSRTEKEKADIRNYANQKIIEELLPVLDNFERALQTKTDDIENYAKGMELIFQQMRSVFEKSGVAEITAEGEKFDPNKHNVVMTEESDELEDGMISKVWQKGYTLNGRVIRPSMVSVVKK